MKKIDLIIDALKLACHETYGLAASDCYSQALAAARELKALKPVAWMGSAGLGYDKNKYLSIPLYALDDEVKHD